MIDTLPDTLSGLLAVALRDAKKARASLRYNLDMTTWHKPILGGLMCQVCMAGAVMAFSLDASIGEGLIPADFPESIQNKLCAINYLRTGQVNAANVTLTGKSSSVVVDLNRRIPSYRFAPTEFFSDLEQLHKDLVDAGL